MSGPHRPAHTSGGAPTGDTDTPNGAARPGDTTGTQAPETSGTRTRPDAPARTRSDVVRVWAARLVLPLSIALWLLSLRSVPIDRMRDLGLLQVMPPLFWVATALLTLGFCLTLSDRRTHGAWLTGYVLALIALIHATPTLLYPTLRYSWAWKHLAVIDAMIRHGGEVPNADKFSVYNDWPGFFQLHALFLRTTGLDSAVGYASWTPPIANVLLLAPLLLLYRSVTRDRRLVWGAVWIFYSCSWVGQDYFAPQSFAFLLFMTVVALLFRQLRSSALPRPDPRRRDGWPPGLLVAVVVIVAAIVVSHPLTPLMLISAMALLSLPRRSRRLALPVLIAAVVLTAAWDATVARSYISVNISNLIDSLTQPDKNVSSGLAALGDAAPGQILLSWVDRGLSAAVALLAIAGLLVRRWTRRTGLPLLAAAPLPLLAVNAYGGEMLFRAYLFSLPAAAFLVAALVLPPNPRRRVPYTLAVYPLLLVMIGALFFGYYGKEIVNQYTLKEVAAARYVIEHAPPGSTIVTLTADVPDLDLDYEKHRRVQLAYQDPDDQRLLVRDPLEGVTGFVYGATTERPAYVVLTRAQEKNLYLTGALPADVPGRLESALSGAEGFTRVYDNGDAVVYRYVTPPP
ncbi:glycosyltransferase [Streptomyces flavochromogenes]|uniref:glycosyltransferase n=1 Tax=Streptomyces flavochromogenes TaxID=68199 RepID=UPI000ADB9CBC|nr:glycosyltransferase [Streptomyces flavochromogenes]